MPANNSKPAKPAKPANRAALYSSAIDDWPTPPAFVAALHAEFGFVLDVCASTANHKAPAYYALDHTDPTRRDGLAADWAADAARLGGAAWMNPPYGRFIGGWMAKAAAAARAGAVVVTLVPVRADTAWWHEHVLATGAEVRYVRGRLTFGDAKNTAAFASAVVIYRPDDHVGVPGPVGIMPAHPTPPTTPAPAAATERATASGATATTASSVVQADAARVSRTPAAAPRTGRRIDSPTRTSHNHRMVERVFGSDSRRVSAATAVTHGAPMSEQPTTPNGDTAALGEHFAARTSTSDTGLGYVSVECTHGDQPETSSDGHLVLRACEECMSAVDAAYDKWLQAPAVQVC